MNWTQVEAIFNAASLLPPAQRAAYLAQACGADEAVRAEVEKLLRSHDAAQSFLEKPLVGADAATQSGLADVDTEPLRIGRYQILRELGRGGMGAVYLAERADGEFKQRVAIKLMRRAGSAWEIARFKQERQMLADLDHPNIARLLDGGTHEGLPYVVMEYLEGESLRALLKRRGALPLDLVVTLTRQLSDGLAAAHERGIVHRDIKPENLMVSEKSGQWRLKILDFGIARAAESNATSGDERNHTRTGLVLGTATYMSPEQARGATGDKIDARSDVYSQGCVLYEMLTGQAAFTGDSFNDVVAKHLYEPPPPFNTLPNKRASAATVISLETTIDESLPSALSSAVETVVRKALAKDRKDRQQSVLELADELETAARQPINDPLRTTPLPQRAIVAATNKLAPPRRWLHWAGAAFIVVSLFGLGAQQWLMKTAPAVELKQQVLPTTPSATLTYRAFRRDPGKAIHPLGLNDKIVIEDDIYLEVTPPVSCAVYFFYEDRTGTLMWANPLPNETPQRALAGQTLRVPTKGGVSIGEINRVQTFLVVYVPTGVNWSLEDAVNPDRLKIVKTPDVYIPYVEINPPAAARLKKYLTDSAKLIEFAAPQDALYSQPLALAEPRAFYHRLELYQRPPR